MDRIIKSNAFKILLVFILFTAFLFSGVTMDVHADTTVTDEAGLIAALAEGGVIILDEDIVLTSGIEISKDTEIQLRGHTISTDFSAPFPSSAISSSSGVLLTIQGPGTVDLSKIIGLNNYAGDITVTDGATLKTFNGSISGNLTVTGKNEGTLSTFEIVDNGFSGTGTVTVIGGVITGQTLSTKYINITDGSSATLYKIGTTDKTESVNISGSSVDAYNANGVQISSMSTISIVDNSLIKNASSVGGGSAKLTIDNSEITGRTEKGIGVTVSGDAEITGTSTLQVSYFYSGNKIIGGNSVITFDNDTYKTGSFRSISSITFKDTPTLHNMSLIEFPYSGQRDLYLYQDEGASFDFQDGIEGITVMLGNSEAAMIHIKDDATGLPGVVYYEGDEMPQDFVVYEGTVTRDTSHFTAYQGTISDSKEIDVLESGSDMLKLAAPVCKIDRNGEELIFYTIKEAFAAAKQGETIELLMDLGYTGSIALDPSTSGGVTEYTLDLAGFAISHSPERIYDNDHIPFVVYNGMTLNIIDSSDSQTGSIATYDFEYPMIFNAGKVNIDGGVYYGILCGASYNGGPEDSVPENEYQSIGSDGEYVIREAYLYHDKTDADRAAVNENNYSIESLSYIKIAERSAIDEDFERGDEHGDFEPFTHIKRVTVSLKFDANGGSGTMEDMELNTGVEITLPECTMTRDGYTFTGWNKKTDGTGTSYADEGAYTPIVDTVLYAQWEKDSTVTLYTVTFDANGGEGTMDAQ